VALVPFLRQEDEAVEEVAVGHGQQLKVSPITVSIAVDRVVTVLADLSSVSIAQEDLVWLEVPRTLEKK
jgi:hypothetical protein